MTSLRHLLLALVLGLAQLLASAHAVDHALGNEEGLPNHHCPLCLTAHDLGAGAPAAVPLPPVVKPAPVRAEVKAAVWPDIRPPRACQRAPPAC